MGEKQSNKIIDYISSPLSHDRINYLNMLNEVTIEKVELFRDFIISLFYLVNDTYLGDDVIKIESDRIKHFNWCWLNIIKMFYNENIVFEEKGEHYYYFLNYFNVVFYNNTKKDSIDMLKIVEFWDTIFSVTNQKTNSQYDIFIEQYKIQNNYLKKY